MLPSEAFANRFPKNKQSSVLRYISSRVRSCCSPFVCVVFAFHRSVLWWLIFWTLAATVLVTSNFVYSAYPRFVAKKMRPWNGDELNRWTKLCWSFCVSSLSQCCSCCFANVGSSLLIIQSSPSLWLFLLTPAISVCFRMRGKKNKEREDLRCPCPPLVVPF